MGLAWCRAYFEKEAYAESVRAAAEVWGIEHARSEGFQVIPSCWYVKRWVDRHPDYAGLLTFGATYHFLPELTGKALWSEAAARWHVWLTFFAGTFNSALWIWQGLEGAPRRFSVLPDAYDALAVAAVPTVIVLALAQILFFLNVFLTLAGPKPERPVAPATA